MQQFLTAQSERGFAMSKRKNNSNRKIKEKKAKKKREGTHRQQPKSLHIYATPHLFDSARAIGEGIFLFPEITKQHLSYLMRNPTSSEVIQLFDKLKDTLQDSYDYSNSSTLYQPFTHFDPLVFLRERFNYCNRMNLEDKSTEFGDVHSAAFLNSLDEISQFDLTSVSKSMLADSNDCLRQIQQNQYEYEIDGNDQLMNLSIRYYQSLLASKLGVQIEYLNGANHPSCLPTVNNQLINDRISGRPNMRNLAPEVSSDEYISIDKQFIRETILHWNAIGVAVHGYASPIPNSIHKRETSFLYNKLQTMNLLPVDRLMAGHLNSGNTDRELVYLRRLQAQYFTSLGSSYFYASNLISLEELEAVEPFINGRRCLDQISRLFYKVHFGLFVMMREDLDNFKISKDGGISNSASDFSSVISDWKCPHMPDWQDAESVHRRFLSDFINIYLENQIPNNTPKKALNIYVMFLLKQLVLLEWSNASPISVRISNMIVDICNCPTNIVTELETFIRTFKDKGLTESSFGNSIKNIDLQGIIQPIQADGKPVLQYIPLPSWVNLLHTDSQKSIKAAEISFNDFSNFVATIRSEEPPEDWSPVLVSFATALENEFARKPYKYALDSIAKDTLKWPDSALQKLTKKSFYKILASEILKKRKNEPNDSPTLGNICHYLDNGLQQVNNEEDLDKHKLYIDFFVRLNDYKNYKLLLSPGFIKALLTFKDYRNEVAHPPPVGRIRANIGRRHALAMLELISECEFKSSKDLFFSS